MFWGDFQTCILSMQTAGTLLKGLHDVWTECFSTISLSSWSCTDGISAHTKSYTFPGSFWLFFDAQSRMKGQCTWRRPWFRKCTMCTYAARLQKIASSITDDMIPRSFIINNRTASSGLSFGECSGNSVLLIFGQFGFHVMVTRKSACPIILEIAIISCISWCLYCSLPTSVDGRGNNLLAGSTLAFSSILPESLATLPIYCSQTLIAALDVLLGMTASMLLPFKTDLPGTGALAHLMAKVYWTRSRTGTNTRSRKR